MRPFNPRRGLLALALLATAGTLVPAHASAPARMHNLVDTSCRLVETPTGTRLAGTPHAAPPVGNPPCKGLRPGAEYVTTVGYCTLGYVFAGSDGATYVATAGHCTLGNAQDTKRWAAGKGPLAGDPATGKEFGRFVYATATNGGTDFGLIRLNPGQKANPQMCHFGGPTGMLTGESGAAYLQHFGNGLGMDYTRARTGYAFGGVRRHDYVLAYAAMSPGDSGGPVNLEGLAVGTVDELRPFAFDNDGVVAITRLPAAIAAASKALKIRLTLRTAPVL